MEYYLNEDEAIDGIKLIVNDTTSDFELYVRGREFSGGIKKKVAFVVVVLPVYGEAVFNSFIKAYIGSRKTRILKSETFIDNTKRKEAFYLECDVKC